jgi:hypothetical protein
MNQFQPINPMDAVTPQMFRCPQRYDKSRRHILKAPRMQKNLTPKGVDGVQRVTPLDAYKWQKLPCREPDDKYKRHILRTLKKKYHLTKGVHGVGR